MSFTAVNEIMTINTRIQTTTTKMFYRIFTLKVHQFVEYHTKIIKRKKQQNFNAVSFQKQKQTPLVFKTIAKQNKKRP